MCFRQLGSPTSPEQKRLKGQCSGDDEVIDLAVSSPESGAEEREENQRESPRSPAALQGRTADDGSVIYRLKGVTLAEAAKILLRDQKFGPVCSSVPQRPVGRLRACTFLVDLKSLGAQVLAGDLACDGYEPWNQGSKTAGQFFRRYVKYELSWRLLISYRSL